jgi:hypothetical protein
MDSAKSDYITTLGRLPLFTDLSDVELAQIAEGVSRLYFYISKTLEERIARAQTQLAKAKENRRKAYERAAKAEKKVERLIAKRPAGKPEIVDAKPAVVQEVAPLP